MQFTRNEVETATGPAEWFTGQVFIDAVAVPSDHSRVNVSSLSLSSIVTQMISRRLVKSPSFG